MASDLRQADLRGANLRDLDLRGTNLEGTDFADADVWGTLFGNNKGLVEADKRDLIQRGAIFQDSLRSDTSVSVSQSFVRDTGTGI
jgi:uncharacterized protein YjbI with pentapeptide repeats